MLLEKINSELGNVDELLESGRIKEITKYLNDNIHKYGDAYNINEVSIRLFNKEMTSKPIINYFINKYSKQ
jgi:carboxypeptidase Taq